MNYSSIINYDIANGTGIGCSLFVSGCNCHCKGCFNSETWDFNSGNPFNEEMQNKFIEMCKNAHIDHISLLGGDFLQQEHNCAYKFVKRLRNEINKPIWCWTGLTFEELSEQQLEIVKYFDVLVDGRFIEELKDLNLKFKGSSNQRVIDVKKTFKENKIVLYEQ